MNLLVCLFVAAIAQLPNAGAVSNSGKTFVQTFNWNHPTVQAGVTHAFILSTDADQCTVTITVDYPPLTEFTVNLNNSEAVVYKMNVTATRGIKLDAPCDFTVYGLNFATQSADGWLAFPVEALGTEYVILGVEPWLAEPTQLTIVAAENNTVCTSTFPNGTQHVSNLNAIGVDYITSTIDMTGTKVSCNNKVTVLSGQRCSNFPKGCIACDHTIDQVPPKSTLGRNFALVPLKHNCTYPPSCCTDPAFCSKCTEIYRILGVEDGTVVVRNGTEGSESFTLKAGESRYILLSQQEISHLVSNKPVLLGHYFPGQGYEAAASDPSFAIIPQIESYGARYQAATCFPQFQTHYVNLVVQVNTSSQLLLNGVPFLDANSAQAIPGTNLEAFQYKFNCSQSNGKPISFKIEHSGNSNFGLFAYGFSPFISYGYPGGMNLNDDVYYKCAPPQLNISATSAWGVACNLTSASANFAAPSTFTDTQCCQGNASLTYVDTVLSLTTCKKEVQRTWTLTDGCGRSISANQTAVIEKQLDSYTAPPAKVSVKGKCEANVNVTGQPILTQDCDTTISVNYTDATDNSTYVNRTWTIQQQCSNQTLTFQQTISCGKSCHCPCRHRPHHHKHEHHHHGKCGKGDDRHPKGGHSSDDKSKQKH